MITFVGIKPEKLIKKSGNPGKSFIEYAAAAFGFEYLEVESVDEIPSDDPVIYFSDHGETDISDFNFIDGYYVFGPDWEDMDIENKISVRIPVINNRFRAIFGSQAAAIVSWEASKRKS